MKRMTIFPSRPAFLAAVVSLGFGALAAPVTVAAQQVPASPASPAQQASPPPATHVVQAGETLWAMAQQFYGDPLFWPEIYRLNTAVIQDPHWIFPGEELHLTAAPAQMASAVPAESAGAAGAGAEAGGAAPAGGITVTPTASDTGAPPPPSAPGGNPAIGPTIFASRPTVSPETTAALRLKQQRAYRAVREGEFMSAGFLLLQGETLDAGTLAGNTATSSISEITTTTSAQLYSTVAVTPPPGATLKVGDVLESFEEPRTIPGYGAVVLPTGLLKVTSAGAPGENVMARVVAMYQTINSGQGVMAAPVYQSRTGVRPVPVSGDSAITGEVIDLRTPHELEGEQDEVFLNRGSDDGVRVGDIFNVTGTAASTIGIGPVVQQQAKVLVVFTRPKVCTAIIIEIHRPDIGPGSAAREIYRMPS